MEYFINHVHIRAKDPIKSAMWYEKYFNAKIVSSRESVQGTISITMKLNGSTGLNISSQHPGGSNKTTPAELNRLGLEHFGFGTKNIDKDISKFEHAGIRIVLPITEVAEGTKIAYIEGPDQVLIELVQSH